MLHKIPGLWDLWAPGARLPQPPPGYVHPVDAFNHVGLHIWEADWMGDEMRASFLPTPELPHSSMVFAGGALDLEAANRIAADIADGLKTLAALHPGRFPESEVLQGASHWDGARQMLVTEGARIKCAVKRRDAIVRLLGDAAASGALRTVHRPKGGGMAQPIAPEAWGIDDYLPRFVSCGVDPDDWTAVQCYPPHRFFLEAGGVRALPLSDALVSEPAQAPVPALEHSDVKPKRARGWAIADAPLVEEIRKAVEAGEVSSPYAAALQLAAQAKGGGVLDSRARRLERRYYDKYPKE